MPCAKLHFSLCCAPQRRAALDSLILFLSHIADETASWRCLESEPIKVNQPLCSPVQGSIQWEFIERFTQHPGPCLTTLLQRVCSAIWEVNSEGRATNYPTGGYKAGSTEPTACNYGFLSQVPTCSHVWLLNLQNHFIWLPEPPVLEGKQMLLSPMISLTWVPLLFGGCASMASCLSPKNTYKFLSSFFHKI